jgi:hypothetical protein
VAPAPDLNALEAQLRSTKAIGLFIKITLKNQQEGDQKREAIWGLPADPKKFATVHG